MNDNWTITYKNLGRRPRNITFTAPSILDAIQQFSNLGIPINDIISITLK